MLLGAGHGWLHKLAKDGFGAAEILRGLFGGEIDLVNGRTLIRRWNLRCVNGRFRQQRTPTHPDYRLGLSRNCVALFPEQPETGVGDVNVISGTPRLKSWYWRNIA